MMLTIVLAAAAMSGGALSMQAVLVRPVEKGELLTVRDFEMVTAASGTARNAMAPADAVGMEATRRLRQGAAVQPGDVAAPRIVRRGEVVTIGYFAGPLAITSSGRALADAGKGEALRVVNLGSSRTLDVIADKPGHVVVPH